MNWWSLIFGWTILLIRMWDYFVNHNHSITRTTACLWKLPPVEPKTVYLLLVCYFQPWPRWATTWAPSFLSRWFSDFQCEAGDPVSSLTASSRFARNSSPWRRPSGRETQPWQATSVSAMRTSCLGPSTGSCEPRSTDCPSAVHIPVSFHVQVIFCSF